MNIINNIVKYFRSSAKSATNASASAFSPRSEVISLGSVPMNIATVYRCVTFLADSVAQLPVRIMENVNGLEKPANKSNLSFLLNCEPNQSTSSFDLWGRIVQDILCWGNAYILPLRSNVSGEIFQLFRVSPTAVTHYTATDQYWVNDNNLGINQLYDESELIHIKGVTGTDPKVGISVLTYARVATETAMAGDAENLSRFKSGGIVRGIVSNGATVRGMGEYQDKELSKTAKTLDERIHDEGERIVALPGQVGFQQISMSSADMQFLASRQFTVHEICRFFGVHPSFVFEDTASNYKSAEMANIAFLTNTLNPLLRKIETELTRKLIPQALRGNQSISFDRSAIHACDLMTKARYQSTLLGLGLTVNEARALNNYFPVEGGDIPLISANYRTVNDLTNQKDSSNGQDE